MLVPAQTQSSDCDVLTPPSPSSTSHTVLPGPLSGRNGLEGQRKQDQLVAAVSHSSLGWNAVVGLHLPGLQAGLAIAAGWGGCQQAHIHVLTLQFLPLFPL